MRKHQLSPSASVCMSLALALGILVADLTNVSRVTVANAQAGNGGSYVPVADATVYGAKIQAVDVVIDGVATSAIFLTSVRVVDSVIYETAGGGDSGVLVGDGFTGVLVGDGLTGVLVGDGAGGVLVGDGAGGVLVGDGAGGVLVGDGKPEDSAVSGGNLPTVSGGVLQGENIKIEDGVIYGEDLRVVGATVTGGAYGY